MASLTIENYVKAIYQLSSGSGGDLASTGSLAEALAVSPSTVTSMLKTLSESGLAEYIPYGGAKLTDAGRTLALRVVRRHRLIELFLVKTLNLTWDEVHAEAEHMEHAVSDLLIDRIDAFLGYPQADPHGDPIPSADGTIAAAAGTSLASLSAGARFRIVRVSDQSPDFLRYLTDAGLEIGSTGTVTECQPQAGIMILHVGQRSVTLAAAIAEKLLVIPQA